MDFIEAYNERINFFRSEVQDDDLLNISVGHFCLALMLTYLGYQNSENNKERAIKMFEVFKENFLIIKNNPLQPMKLRILFRIFYFFPKTSRWFVQTLNLK